MEGKAQQATAFDFDAYRRLALERYGTVRPKYEEFSDRVRSILQESLVDSSAKVASYEARAKTLESFAEKAGEPSGSDPDTPRYSDPLGQITDLAGVRVITFFPGTVDQVDKAILDQFDVVEKTDKAELLKREDKLGYQSVHYLVKLKANRVSLPEYSRYKDLIAEIQVRTILQHAWAEIEHDIQYKSLETIPTSIRRRFMLLAGMLEIVDREFEAVQAEDERLRLEARVSVQQGRLDQVEITPDALKAYLDRKLGSDGRISDSAYQWEATTLRRLGFVNFQQIDEAIAGFDDDDLSRKASGWRQGQLTRFEYMMLAGMGENFLKRHPWGTEEWFTSYRQRILNDLREAGVAVRDYSPANRG
jgi:ppGpp synthetase/RelA/SpoT-type nucleotidyltranferase